MSESKSKNQALPSPEPKARRMPTPLWAVTLVGLFAFVGVARMVNSGGAFDANVYGPYRDFAEVDKQRPVVPQDPRVVAGRKVFAANCAACHQAQGQGAPPLFPPLAGSDWVNADGHTRLIRIVLHGLKGPIKVNGKEFDNNMLAWKDILKDDDVANVLSYVRSESKWGNKASLVTPEEVKEIRAKEAGRGEQWTAPELLEIPLK